MIDCRLYLVTDDPSRYRGDWLENVAAAVDSGVTCVQYRDTESDATALFGRVRRLQDLLRARRIPLIVNNGAELAATIRADGVHVGQGDLPPRKVREIVGTACEIGYSITDLSQIDSRAEEIAASDCLGIGPVYDATRTKSDAARAMGPDGLAEIVARVPEKANVAIGGVTLETAPAILAAGAKGLAVVSAFSRAEDPAAVARSFRRLFG